jgi:hypothetical protein
MNRTSILSLLLLALASFLKAVIPGNPNILLIFSKITCYEALGI